MRARGVEPLHLKVSEARTNSIGGMGKKSVLGPICGAWRGTGLSGLSSLSGFFGLGQQERQDRPAH